MEGEVYSALSLPAEAAEFESEETPNPKKKKNKNRKKFSDEQIRSLESIFESETKLEARKKVQLAWELGLQPRQVAIWFQNRRARWKSKKIEQSYRVLKANYDNLHSQFEALKKEKQSLLIQVQELSDLLEQNHDQGSRSKDLGGDSTPGGSDGGDTHCDLKTKPSCLKQCSDRAVTYSDDDERGNAEPFPLEKAEILNTGAQVYGSLILPEKWCSFDSSGPLDQTCGNSNWWDIWT
ncbi:Homeobox-leucine zipper protein like [Actinidia chinensis var. chinensis]|uniref:Homeobox-leucine zipper protein n=1 Tax=Actinidia chinensis var. chinensis TaxID=1590841 RepID=A0A2R6QPT3_ACTCC|nr:Homeobox-leucine zipper protein like [Actinidia chinensis var. chinensis]